MSAPTIPLDVLLQGPAAAAAWLAKNEADHDRRRHKLLDLHKKVLATCEVAGPGASNEDILLAVGACALTAALIMHIMHAGNRGKARDALSEVIDGSFDSIDMLSERNPELRALMEGFK